MFRRGAVAAISGAVLLAALAGCKVRSEHPALPSPPLAVKVDFFGLSLVEGASPKSARLDVNQAEYRTRLGAGGLITYHDLTELELVGVEVMLESEAPLPFSEYVGRLQQLLEFVEDRSITSREGDKTLTRVLFKELVIRQISPATTLVLSAGRARLAPDTKTLILEGGMTIANGSGQAFEAPHAVLTSDYNAMFARGGRWRGGRQLGRSTYLVVDDAGQLSTSGRMFEPTYADAVERRERMMLEHLLERAPAALKPLVYALLQASHSAAPSPRPKLGSALSDTTERRAIARPR